LQGATLLPDGLKRAWGNGERWTNAALGQDLAKKNACRQAIGAYLNAAGIESGYGFFAPNIPAATKLVFELHYSDGRIEHELPSVHGRAAGLRLSSLLDLVGRTKDDVVREGLIKFLALAVGREHPDVVMIHAILGTVIFPSPADYAKGKREAFESLYAYDFKVERDVAPPTRN
jgi:hypothetical protein